ncbi:MAG: hypothetical protein EPN98_21270 [Phenylobacterium sp.]|uniref:hypothetical protein n=1 Tax=Phenylobacterium sp. TaxID=1871053 RepID=UPI0012246C79|nr:hypothetical protein [Phenylobacterium sp.]TAL28975.1 MAG: hypothetical protein EPN98_21270 [Phenylobacterium sp.]
MCSTDYDPADIFEVSYPRARKRHGCDECHVDVLPGERYAKASWLADGSWSSSVRCLPCLLLCELIEDFLCGGRGQILWGGGDLAEEIDHAGSDWAAETFAAIKDRMLDAPRPSRATRAEAT